MTPRSVTFPVWARENNASDDGFGDILALLSPSGRMSKRARASAGKMIEAKQAKAWAAEDLYRALVDRGEIVDPSGAIRAVKIQDTPEYRQELGELLAANARIEYLSHFIALKPKGRKNRSMLAETEIRKDRAESRLREMEIAEERNAS